MSDHPASTGEYLLVSTNEETTRKIGELLAGFLSPPSLVGLIGTLGSGKTRLVQGLARGCGVAEAAVISPTFVLIHEYPGRVPVFHFDVYRLKDSEEFLELGVDEYFQRPGICVVEWADRVADALPPERLDVELSIVDSSTRHVILKPLGEHYRQAVEKLTSLWHHHSGDNPR
ncbi:tRNA (adenosine(37)-N6)-threonylcarbamoyltransferase complex ATPase subunit type 1 TsaE [Thermogutta sp.]|uniref:tRNA (adenosine(37)-N6)-threonylcarbamoyltransferase complex ATPase subunit type 1 TsaE n=1 Tax=Thermogutta sp. TaxID=1962930 RepID=UPI0032202A98